MSEKDTDKKKIDEEAAPEAATPQASSELEVQKDKLIRLQADFDNFRKRTLREKSEIYARANEQLMVELLPVLDHFEMALTSAAEHKTEESVRHGFQIVYDQLLGAAKKHGLTPVDVHSAAFDPHLHEAITHVPSNEYPADDIVSQVRRGYKLGEKLLRPIQVIVSSGPGALRDDEGQKTDAQP